MAPKKAARRRAADKRARRARRAKATGARPPVEDQLAEDELVEDQLAAIIMWMLEATGADRSAAAYFGQHGECTICRVRVGAVAVQFVDVPPSSET